jgi:PAS domain S-box-containing protein
MPSKPHERHETFFRALIENAAELITVLDGQGRVLYENPANATFIGYEPEETEGLNVFELIHPDDRGPLQAAFARLVASPGGRVQAAHRIRHKDGSWRWLESSGTNLLHVPDVAGVVVNSRDITERVAAEEKIRELNELRNKFIGIVAHQLRTPLSAIRWNLEALIADAGAHLMPEQLEYARSSLSADVEVIRRINDMLTALDIEEGRVVLKREAVSVEELGAPILGELKRRCEEKGVSFRYEGPVGGLPKLKADPAKIREVFRNLADNAVSYTPKGGAVTVRVRGSDGKLRFEVEDTGVGIPEAEREKIFKRFYRASNASAMKPDADGVGLSIAKYYVEQHGGAIGFESAVGKGSTFWFELPL